MKKIYLLVFTIFSLTVIQSYKLCAQVPVTVAGGNGAGSSANQFDVANDVFVDPAGNLYIADQNNNRVQKWLPGATQGITVAGGTKGSLAQNLNAPSSVFVDPSGNVYVVDQFNFRVQKWAPGATFGITVAGGGQASMPSGDLRFPWGVFVDAAGNVYVTDRVIGQVRKYAPGSAQGVLVAGGNGPGADANQLNSPYGIFVDAAGNIYIGDANNNRVQKWAPGASSGVTVAGGNGFGSADNQVGFPVDLSVDAQENIYISDPSNHRIVKWAAGATNGTTIIGGADTATTHLQTPYGFSIDAKGNFYVADRDNNRILKYAFTAPLPTPPATGLSYRYYEGSWSMLPDFNQLTPVKTGTSDNIDLGVRTPGHNDNFAFVWEGYLNIPAPGNYTFETVSDDGSKFYFNNFYDPTVAATVSNDGVHAPVSVKETITISSPGSYPVAMTFFEKDGGEQMQAYWSGPGFTRQLIPGSAFTKTPAPTTGLAYKYYEGNWDALPNFDSLTPVKTGFSPNVNISARPQGVNDHFAFVWQGYINIAVPGTYTFETVSDDGSKLYFNQPFNFYEFATVRNDGVHAPTSATGTVTVTSPGLYPVTITYFEKDQGEQMQVYWTGPGIPRQLIPDIVFTQTPRPNKGLSYKFYNWPNNYMPDFTTLIPAKTGASANVDISVRPSSINDHFAFMWQGYMHFPSGGTYTLELLSDDGSRFYFNHTVPAGFPLVANDGVHAPTSATVTFSIPQKQAFPVAITYFEYDGGEQMQLYWSGPGITRQLVPDSVFTINESDIVVSQFSEPTVLVQQNNVMAAASQDVSSLTKIYPNPFYESFNIDFYNSSATNDIRVGIYDMDGKLIYMQKAGHMLNGNNTLKIKLNKNQLVQGLYVARLQVNGVPLQTVKLLKRK